MMRFCNVISITAKIGATYCAIYAGSLGYALWPAEFGKMCMMMGVVMALITMLAPSGKDVYNCLTPINVNARRA